MEIRDVLEAVRSGEIEVSEAERLLRTKPFVDLGYAKADTHRRWRQGSPEVIYGAGKTPEQCAGIAETLMREGSGCVMVTRCPSGVLDSAESRGLDAEYFPEAGICVIGKIPEPRSSYVCIVSAGTSDIPVAEEAAVTAAVMGCRVRKVYDAGVAGLHRLLSFADDICGASAVVAVAGMEALFPALSAG